MLPFAFEHGMRFERYVDYALRCRCISSSAAATIKTSRAPIFVISAGRLAQPPGERATLADWANHLSSIFPKYVSNAISKCVGPMLDPGHSFPALPALFVGLLYEFLRWTRLGTWVKNWSAEER